MPEPAIAELAVDLQDRKEKRDVYREIAVATYPLLYALSSELSRQKPLRRSGRDALFSWHRHVSYDETRDSDIKLYNSETLETMKAAVAVEDIPVTEAPLKRLKSIIYSDFEKPTMHDSLAKTDENRALYDVWLEQLTHAFSSIHRKGDRGLTNQVNEAFREKFPGMGERLTISSAFNTSVDGLLTTFRTAAWLSQMPIKGREDMGFKERMLAVLRSDAVTEFTKRAKINTLAHLPALGIVPQQQLEFDEDGMLRMHPDAVKFVELFADLEEGKKNEVGVERRPLKCPFIAALGDKGVEQAIERYGDALPDPVVEIMQYKDEDNNNAYKSGMRIAGEGIAAFLEKSQDIEPYEEPPVIELPEEPPPPPPDLSFEEYMEYYREYNKKRDAAENAPGLNALREMDEDEEK